MRLNQAALVAMTVALLSLMAWVEPAYSQTLDLSGIPPGPALPEKNAASDLAETLEVEARAIVAESSSLEGEAKAGALARARIRGIAAHLLRAGSIKGWEESAPAVSGARLALLIGRVDSLVGLAVTGRATRERELSPAEAKRALALLQAIDNATSEQIRRAMVAPSAKLATEVTRALASTLAPLVELATLLEGSQNDDPWPVLIDARASQADRASSPRSIGELETLVRAMPEGAEREALATAVASAAAAQASLYDLSALAGAAETLRWLVESRSAGAPYPFELAALESAISWITRALREIASGADASAVAIARTSLDALSTTAPAARSMIDFRKTDGLTEPARRALSDAAAALLAADAGTSERERERVRAAARISEACACAKRLDMSLVTAAPKDLRDLLRQFDRDARIAVRALPQAFQAIASSPIDSVEPGNLSALDRIKSLEADRLRILALQSMIDSIAAVRPTAGRGFASVAKRLTKLLTDPLKRSEGQTAFNAVQSQFSSAFPFAYEEDLKRRTKRAVELAGGAPEKVIERAAAIRAEWCDAVGRGDFGGEASKRLDLAARLCRALSDLNQVIEPIDRAAGDRLGMWGPWPMRRAMVAPATQDLVARSALASRSFVAANTADGRATFERDLAALETAIPLVRLAAALERKVAPTLRGDPDTVGAQLAPLLAIPQSGSYLASEWTRLLALHRAMMELEYARRVGEPKLRDSLNGYLAALARELDQAAFGAQRPIMKVPGFDGTQPLNPPGKGDSGKPGRPRDSSRDR